LNAHAGVLLLHSLLRWAVLLAAVIVMVRAFAGSRGARPWTRGDDVSSAIMVGLIDVQFLLGLALYAFLSRTASAFFADPHAAMANPVLRFFAVEHAFAMVVALVIAHVGRVLSRKAMSPAQRHRRAGLTALVVLAVLLIGIPWPFLPYGRPLLRGLP
jgi:hypothetical protein